MAIREIGLSEDASGYIKTIDIEDVDIQASPIRDGWVLDGRVPVTPPITCRIPYRIVIFMRSIERIMQLQSSNPLEFGVFLKGYFQDGILNVDENAQYVPHQKVSSISIDFQEDPPDNTYNGVIHRHPRGCTHFSGTDDQYINVNFEFSLLYVNNDITGGIINITSGNVRIQLPLTIEVIHPIFDIRNPDIIKEKIEEIKIERPILPIPGHNNIHSCRNGTIPFGGDVIDQSINESENNLYFCCHCGEINVIDGFPYRCDSCDLVLSNNDEVDLITNIDELEPSLRLDAYEKLSCISCEED